MEHDSRTRYEGVAAVRAGATLREAAAACGASHESVRRWCAAEGIAFAAGPRGGAALPTRRKAAAAGPPARLGLEQRLAIAQGLAAGLAQARVAEGIGFSRSTVSRELSRNGGAAAYDPYEAQARAEREAARPKARKLDSDPRLRAYVLERLALRWSPRQISARMAEEFPGDEGARVSHETIYRAIYVQGRGSLRQELRLESALRTGRRSRVPRSALPPRAPGKSWVEGCEISLRPAEADGRAVPGHWEGDLVIGGDMRSCLLTLVERTTRFLLVRRFDLHPTELITSALAEMVADLPADLVRSVTWDQGVEMAAHASFTERTGVRVYFCDPRSPWQRGTNENTNGLVRDYFPKGTDFTKVSDGEVREMQDQLNSRPRETLGWRTPAERLAELLENVA